MKYIFFLIIILMAYNSSYSQNMKTNPAYDSVLAKKLNADENGMKKYVFVLLKSGENKNADKNFKDSCFKGHMANIERLAKEGILIVAGPFFKNDRNYRGIFIFNCSGISEAEQICQSDPAIANKLLSAECTEWYGSAALSEYLEASDKIWKSRK